MPCPFFEPQRKVEDSLHPSARLPLIYEFEGICHVGKGPVDHEHRFHYCNRGYAEANCPSFPIDAPLSALRFDIAAKTASSLTVLMIEEKNHWPGLWSRVEFTIAEGRLTPDIQDACRRSQIFHFCRSYLEKSVHG